MPEKRTYFRGYHLHEDTVICPATDDDAPIFKQDPNGRIYVSKDTWYGFCMVFGRNPYKTTMLNIRKDTKINCIVEE